MQPLPSFAAQRQALLIFFAQNPGAEIELDDTTGGRFDAAHDTPQPGWDLQASFLQSTGIYCFITDPAGNQPDDALIYWMEASEEAIGRAYLALREVQNAKIIPVSC